MRAIAGGAVPSLKPTFTRVRQSCVVGVRQAAFRLCLRRIRRGQIPQVYFRFLIVIICLINVYFFFKKS